MLSYTPVTDLVRHTDDPANAELLPVAAQRRHRSSRGTLRAAE